MTTAQKMMGFDSPSDMKVTVRVGDWNAMKLAIWRSKIGWEIVTRTASEVVAGCEHVPGCPGKTVETEPCRAECPDRELRMSALVILNASRTCMPTDARKPAEGTYFAPTREYFSEVLAELSALQVENKWLREALQRAGVEPPTPDAGLALSPRPVAQLEETNT